MVTISITPLICGDTYTDSMAFVKALHSLQEMREHYFAGTKLALRQACYITPIGLLQADKAPQCFLETRLRWQNKSTTLAYSIVQQFAPDHVIGANIAHQIGCAFLQDAYPNHEAVVSTYAEQTGLHNYIILNAVCAANGEEADVSVDRVNQELTKALNRVRNENEFLPLVFS